MYYVEAVSPLGVAYHSGPFYNYEEALEEENSLFHAYGGTFKIIQGGKPKTPHVVDLSAANRVRKGK